MNNSWKNILQVATVVVLIGGISYLGFRLTRLNQSTKVDTSSAIIDIPTSSEGPAVESNTAEEAGADECTSSDQCTVITEQQKMSDESIKTVIQCLNREYLKTCINCKTSEALVAETTKDSACSCVNKYCELIPNQ
jgi:hypothetical protein